MIYLVTKKEWFVNSDKIVCLEPDKIPRIIRFLSNESKLGFDTETEGFDFITDRLFCYQIGTTTNQFVIDQRVVPISVFKELLETTTLVGVNLKFDLKFLFNQGIYPKHVIDVMIIECILTSGLYTRADIKKEQPYSFKTLSEKYLNDKTVDKTIGKAFSFKSYEEPLFTDEIIYSAKDVINPLFILEEQESIIEIEQLTAVSTLENKFTIALASIEYNGIYLDTADWSVIKQNVDVLLLTALATLKEDLYQSPVRTKTIELNQKSVPLFYEYETIGGDLKKVCSINWSSPNQVKQVFNLLGIDVDSISQQQLLKLKKDYPFIASYLKFKQYDAIKSKFSDKLTDYIHPVTKRIHTEFWQVVATGRMSASNPALQQIPAKGEFGKQIRHSFKAQEGNVLVTSDFSGCELRIIAEGSQDPLWVKTFNEKKDLHGVIASELFGITPEESRTLDFPLKPGTTYRDVVKIVNFGLAYGLTEYKLSDTLGCTIDEAITIIDSYFAKVPDVKKYLAKLADIVKLTGKSETFAPIRRPRYFDLDKLNDLSKFERLKRLGSYQRAGMNAPIQGCNADIIKTAVVSIYELICKKNLPVKLVMILHDELVCEVSELFADEWKIIQERLMIEAGQVFIKTVPIVVDSKISTYWSH